MHKNMLKTMKNQHKIQNPLTFFLAKV